MATISPFAAQPPDADPPRAEGWLVDGLVHGDIGVHADGSKAIHKKKTKAQLKAESRWQSSQWKKWPDKKDWPGTLDVYESAAYLRVSPDLLRSRLRPGRDRKAELGHQRIGGVYRIDRSDLDNLGRVLGRRP